MTISQNGGSIPAIILGTLTSAIATHNISKIISIFTSSEDKYKEIDVELLNHIDNNIIILKKNIDEDEKELKKLTKNINESIIHKINNISQNIYKNKEHIEYLKYFRSKLNVKVYTFAIIIKMNEKYNENRINKLIKNKWNKYWNNNPYKYLKYIDIFVKNGYMFFDCNTDIKLNSKQLDEIKTYLYKIIKLFNIDHGSNQINHITQSQRNHIISLKL